MRVEVEGVIGWDLNKHEKSSRSLGPSWKFEAKLKKFRWCQWGAERRVQRMQTREQGPPLAPAEFYKKNVKYVFIKDRPQRK